MLNLFNTVRLDSLKNIRSHTDRIIVGRSADDIYVKNHDPYQAEVLHYTRDYKAFVNQDLLGLLEGILAGDRPAVIYADEEANVYITAFWLKHLFPHTTFEQFKTLFFLHFLNQEASDPTFTWDSARVSSTHLRKTYAAIKRDDDLTQLIRDHAAELPFLYRLSASCTGEIDYVTASEVRDYIYGGIETHIDWMRQRLRTMYFTDAMTDMLGCASDPCVDKGHPLSRLEAFTVTDDDFDLDAALAEPETFAKAYRQDVETFATSSANTGNPKALGDEAMVVLDVYTTDDAGIVDAYIQAFSKVDRFGLLIPPRTMNLFQFNLFMMVTQAIRHGREPVEFILE